MTEDLALPDGLPEYGLTGLGALGIVWVLGPSVRAFGRNLGRWTDYHTENLLRLSEKVKARMGDDEPKGDEGVHPRVAKEILDAAAWIDDDLHQEYLAGLIVDSRSHEGKDDGAIFYTRIVAAMTASQVRLHHALYGAYLGTRKEGEREGFGFTQEADCRLLTVSATTVSMALCASNGNSDSARSALSVATSGLKASGLLADTGYENRGQNKERYQLMPSLLGATVYGKAMFSPPLGAQAIRWAPVDLLRDRPPIYPVPADVTYPPLVDMRISAAT